MNGITLERLEVLKKLKGSKGLLGAAARSKSKQGLYSRQVRALEAACGMRLVNTVNRRLQLNQKGKAVVLRYEQLLKELGRDCQPVKKEKTIQIGGGEIVLMEGVIPLLADYMESMRRPLQFRNLRSSDSIRLFREGELDLVLSSVNPNPLKEGEVCKLLFEQDYIIVTRSKVGKSNDMVDKTLIEQKLILLEGETPIRAFLQDAACKFGQKLNLVALCSTYAQILTLVNETGFIGLVPSICASAALRKGLVVERLISERPLTFKFWMLYRHIDSSQDKDLASILRVIDKKDN